MVNGVVNQIPIDPTTLVHDFNLEPAITSYLCCQSCYALYPYNSSMKYEEAATPRICGRHAAATEPACGHPLWEGRTIGGKNIMVPRMKYVHLGLKEWLGRLLARPGVEEILDKANRSSPMEDMRDIHDSPFWNLFLGPDKRPFMTAGGIGNEGRYMFSFGMDGFNPFQAKEAKQTVSATAIYLVLLNFPPELRYLPENMYLVGVIPGPGHPSLDAMNHALDLLVDDFLAFWEPGVRFSCTHMYREGRLCRAAVVPVVCDMLAARQAGGFSSATSKFFCTCCKITIQGINNLDKDSWQKRDYNVHLSDAMAWQDAETVEDQENIFKKTYVHWSALLRLPYWIPSEHTVVESMHMGPLGVFKDHCCVVWGIDMQIEGGDGTAIPLAKEWPSNDILQYWVSIIRDSLPVGDRLEKRLEKANKAILWHICYDTDLPNAGTKGQLIDEIVGWVSSCLCRFCMELIYLPASRN